MGRKRKGFLTPRRSRRLAGLAPSLMHSANRLTVQKRRNHVVIGRAVASQTCNETGSTPERDREIVAGCVKESSREATGDHKSDADGMSCASDRLCSSAGLTNISTPEGTSRTDDPTPGTSRASGDGPSVGPSNCQRPVESSPSASDQQFHRTELAEEGEEGPRPGGSCSGLAVSSTGATGSNMRELTGPRRPTQDIMQTFTDHLGGVPVQGESYCRCPKRVCSKDLQCTCGEEDNSFEWMWDRNCKSAATEVSENGREARFHVNYSSGTAAVRGSEPMTDRQYFWEIKMTTPVYGTDMMVGVGTASADLDAFQYNFCSLLGRDGESWGLSYYGKAQHKGQFTNVTGARFGQGSILGMHLDMWQGTLSYYKNRQPLGVIFSGLRGKTLYAMVSSTAARTGMKLVKACSYATSLEFLCCQVLRKMVPQHLDVTTALSMPPGLHEFFLVNNLFWLLRSNKLSIPNMESGQKRSLSCDEETEDLEADGSQMKRPRTL